MNPLLEAIKREVKKSNETILLYSGLIAALLGISGLAIHIFESRINIVLTCAGLFFILRRICRLIIYDRKESFGVIRNTFSKKAIIGARITNVIIYALWLPLLFLLYSLALPPKSECTNTKNLGLLISSFTPDAEDDFSYVLFSKLQPEIENSDTISTIRSKHFMQIGSINYVDSLKKEFSRHCFNHGILVFGKRSESEKSKLFNCNIYLNNLDHIRSNTDQYKGKNILYLQNPDLINFTLDSQANVVAEFIIALLNYNAGNIEVAKNKFTHAIELSGDKRNSKLISYCKLYIGNSYFLEKNFLKAKEAYQEGINSDSTNAYMHFNLASCFLALSDSISADSEYTTAQNLNDRLSNPLVLRAEKHNDSAKNKPETKPDSPKKIKPITKPNAPQKDSSDQKMGKSDFHFIEKGDKLGLANANGDTIIKCEYDAIGSDEIIIKGKSYFIVKKGSRYGALDLKGNIAIPFAHPTVEQALTALRILLSTGAL